MDDADVINCLKMLTFVPIEEIEAMEQWEGAKLNQAKEILAWELTKDVHGKDEADKALSAAKALFVSGGDDANMPSTQLADDDFQDGAIAILDLLVRTGLAPSKSEARRLVQQNGVSIDSGDGFAAIGDVAFTLPKDVVASGKVLVKKGKKVFHKVTI